MKIRFNKIWEEVIKPLEGETVYTLEERKSNKIFKVSDEYLEGDSENDSFYPNSIKRSI